MGISLLFSLGDPSDPLQPVGKEERQGDTVSPDQVAGSKSSQERHDPEEHDD